MKNKVDRKWCNDLLGLKEKLVENQASLKGNQISGISLSGEGSVLRLSQFTFCFSSGPILQALI